MSDVSESRPILSVCIPAFGSGAWLVARVRAWLAAVESAAVEIVVSDNASSDGTAEALAAIGDRRLRLVRQASNVGPFENQLRALEAARGRYVMQMTDKDELLPDGLPAALAALEPLDVACGEFVLNSAGGAGGSVDVRRGFAAYKRYGLLFTHPSGHFFSSGTLERFGLLARLRALDPIVRPYSTDYLVSLALLCGAYARIDRPLVAMNLPPYEGASSSVTYRDPSTFYFTPDFLAREFAAYLGFLRGELRLSPLARLRLAAHFAGGAVFSQMTLWYRWRLEDEATCAWYGADAAFRERELAQDLEGNAAARLRSLAGIGRLERLAVRAGVARRRRQRRRMALPENIGRRTT